MTIRYCLPYLCFCFESPRQAQIDGFGFFCMRIVTTFVFALHYRLRDEFESSGWTRSGFNFPQKFLVHLINNIIDNIINNIIMVYSILLINIIKNIINPYD